MFKVLIGLGMILTPFLTFAGETRPPKMIAAIVMALCLSLWALYKNGFKPFKNKWLFLFLAAMIPTSIFAVPLSVKFGELTINNSIALQTAFTALVFALMIVSVYSFDFNHKDIADLLNIAVWCGFIMSCYCLLQFFHIEQFFKLIDPGKFHQIGGTMGNPCAASAFIAILVPIALCTKNYFKAAIMALAVICTWRHVSIFSMLISVVFLYSMKDFKSLMITSAIVMVLSGVGAYYLSFHVKTAQEIVNTSGRVQAWVKAVKDVNTGGTISNGNLEIDVTPHPITGLGLGSFGWLNHLWNKNKFAEAHNEYLEVMYDMGIVGLVFMLLSLSYIFLLNFKFGMDFIRLGVFASFICSCLIAGGFFIWHLGSTMFYGAFFAGLLHKEALYVAK